MENQPFPMVAVRFALSWHLPTNCNTVGTPPVLTLCQGRGSFLVRPAWVHSNG